MAQQTHKNLDLEPAADAVNTYFLMDPSLLSTAQQLSLSDGQLVERARYLIIDKKVFRESQSEEGHRRSTLSNRHRRWNVIRHVIEK